MAWFIVDAEVRPIKLDSVRKQFKKVEKAVKEEIQQLYEVTCDKCGKLAITRQSVWSTVVICPNLDCSKVVVLSEVKKASAGRYVCPANHSYFGNYRGYSLKSISLMWCLQLIQELSTL